MSFIAPTRITALSVVVADLARWCAIGGGLAVLGAAACYAVSAIAVRILSRTGTPRRRAWPFEYSALAWGMALDWLLWQALPDGYTLLGAAIIVASGVYPVRREAEHAAAPPP